MWCETAAVRPRLRAHCWPCVVEGVNRVTSNCWYFRDGVVQLVSFLGGCRQREGEGVRATPVKRGLKRLPLVAPLARGGAQAYPHSAFSCGMRLKSGVQGLLHAAAGGRRCCDQLQAAHQRAAAAAGCAGRSGEAPTHIAASLQRVVAERGCLTTRASHHLHHQNACTPRRVPA
jgi:hypothetical protein